MGARMQIRLLVGAAGLMHGAALYAGRDVPPGEIPVAAMEVPAVAGIPEAPKENLLLPYGSTVFVTVDQAITTQDVNLGDRFHITVERDVIQDGHVAIAAGTKGVGEITFVTKKGGFGKPGILGISLNYLQIGDRQLPLIGRYREEGRGNGDEAAATMFAVGIFAAAVTGKHSVIPAGRSLKARTGEEYGFTPPVPPPAQEAAPPAADTAIPTEQPIVIQGDNR